MRVLILGGDGYIGWPTAMHLSAAGHEVTVADNYLRRRLMLQTDNEALFPVPTLDERARLWEAHSGHRVEVRIGDLQDWSVMAALFEEVRPDTVIHYAEQPSAPYSMIDRASADLTLKNNLGVTFNVIHAMREFAPDAHLVKLGTMGEYGTPNIDIEEGWIEIEHKGRSDRFLFPRAAGSLYHTTKVLDTDLLWFYVRAWGLRVTDLMQGPVYGLETEENAGEPRLYSFLNYDEVFGTVLNRFMVQAVAGYPLTVYGKGGQTRGYLHMRDALQCVRLAVETPAAGGELRVFNQFVETFSVNDLAERVRASGARLGLDVGVRTLPNPRKEMEEHYYNPAHTGLLELGLHPTPLTGEEMDRMMKVVRTYRDRIEPDRIFRGVSWTGSAPSAGAEDRQQGRPAA
ncbi:NAD-dependent epimerase/dehydratase family protein [Histidinibacterium aquaticum]|uniref:NAD-dependent epimerase/dehydratase family protein n=1 Tax=Histidinibacterium aquaticum TaxID=2613962 RepID=A0A5J5GIC6_9RHOB|nr:NAD-dependent epimerase/dehydratase family protein [Histidinibacterium aquaticum]KAA9007877.1 NAD-dependent epimerase/dehydratase family protein [Histidinibacterium aquaticum]